jgi:hypothetical protein
MGVDMPRCVLHDDSVLSRRHKNPSNKRHLLSHLTMRIVSRRIFPQIKVRLEMKLITLDRLDWLRIDRHLIYGILRLAIWIFSFQTRATVLSFKFATVFAAEHDLDTNAAVV